MVGYADEMVQSGVQWSRINHLWSLIRHALITTADLITVVWRLYFFQWTLSRSGACVTASGSRWADVISFTLCVKTFLFSQLCCFVILWLVTFVCLLISLLIRVLTSSQWPEIGRREVIWVMSSVSSHFAVSHFAIFHFAISHFTVSYFAVSCFLGVGLGLGLDLGLGIRIVV